MYGTSTTASIDTFRPRRTDTIISAALAFRSQCAQTGLFRGLPSANVKNDPAEVADALRTDRALSEPLRHVTLRAVLLRALAQEAAPDDPPRLLSDALRATTISNSK